MKHIVWKCPNCSAVLTPCLEQKPYVLRCEHNHSFDIAAAGYTHLLVANQKNSKNPGDDKAMVAARADFLRKGYYEPLQQTLAEAAVEATAQAYAPYSKFNVGAAVLFDDGVIVKGANQENAAYPSGLCAERTALFYASASRPDKAMTAIAIAASQNGELLETPVTPCGACRQVMAQYQLKGGKPMAVILVGGSKIWKFEKVDDLLPLIFDSI